VKKANRNIIAILLALFMIFSLCACNGDISTETPTPNDTVTTPAAESSLAEEAGFTINGATVSDWTVAVDPYTAEGDAVAEQIVTFFASFSGERMPIVETPALTGKEKNLICVGALGRNMEYLDPFSGDYYLCDTDKKGSVISLISTGNGWSSLVDRLENAVVEEKKGAAIALTVPEHEYIRFSIEDHFAAWNLRRELREELFDGVTYIAQDFVDEDGLPYHTFALIVDPEKVTFHMGASNDGYELTPAAGDRQTTLEHMQAAVDNGKNVIAGINANFFNMDGDYSPKGLALKDGVVINGVGNSYPFFAVTEDGECIIDDANTYRRYERYGKNFVQGVAGNTILMKDGLLTRGVDAQALHPRTLVGICEDGKVVFGVIDGRQEGYSNGASYASSAIWMRTLGARTVMNLDGGGSSTFVVREPRDGSYTVCNSPSDGNLRKVYNSVLVSLKSEES